MTGPMKGVLQLLIMYNQMGFHQYNVVNCLLPDACAKEINDEFLQKGIRIQEYRNKRRDYLGIVKSLRELIRYREVNLIQTHGYKQTFIGMLVKMVTSVKWICFMHGRTSENLQTELYHTADSVLQLFSDTTVLVSEAQRRKIIHGDNYKRVKVIRNGVDIDNPVRGSGSHYLSECKSSSVKNRFTATVVGRLSPEKGVDIFLRSLAIARSKGSECWGIIVGDGSEKAMLLELVEELGVSSFVEFVGYSKTPRDYIEQTDIVVLPSRSEGIPNVALESMALKKAVVATNVGGVPEVINNSSCGILVNRESPEELADAISQLSSNPNLVKRLSIAGFLRVQEFFSPFKRAEQVYSLYLKVLKDSSCFE